MIKIKLSIKTIKINCILCQYIAVTETKDKNMTSLIFNKFFSIQKSTNGINAILDEEIPCQKYSEKQICLTDKF